MRDHAVVVIKPPLLFGGALLLGSFLTWRFPIGPGLAGGNRLGLAVGTTFAALGLALGVASVLQFRRAGTSVVPGEPSTTLVQFGPFSLTRNPIYIGFVLLYFGLAIVLTSAWMLLLLVPVLLILQHGVVKREEAYLLEKFGEAYRKYSARVPRWL
jgi:protein-S-isoprenylcysteine O-methyltransferase Ste14